ncbi:MAG: polysaccharide pyruvyl transferase family protein [Candidatus Pacebacteria bacterium]|nr:polysaccharide pyruvyl transferase family protein [Candidatus Paceibacterota bacterium]
MSKKLLKIGHIHIWDRKNKGNDAITKSVRDMLSQEIKMPLEVEEFPVEILQNLNEVNLKRLNDCDLILVGGGGIYHHYFLPFDIKNIRKIEPPLVVFGAGYIKEIGGQSIDDADKESLFELNDHAALSSVRDFKTMEFLSDLGVAQGKIDIVGDPAIFLQGNCNDDVKFDTGRIKIGLNINYSNWPGFIKYEELIINSYNQVGNYFFKKFGAQIYYLKHHPDESGIIKKLDIENLEIVDLEARSQKYAYARLDLVLGMMLHSAVLAFGAETPFINLGYDIRNKSFGDFIGLPELVICANELQENMLAGRMLDVFERGEEYRKKIRLRKEEIFQSQTDFWGKINNVALNLK